VAAVAGGGGGCGGSGGGGGWRWWGQGSRPVGPAALGFLFFCFMKNALPRAKWALGTAVPRVWALTHGRAAFAGPAVPGALCRELPLGTGCAESNQACAERIALSAQARIPVVKHHLHQLPSLGIS
jgi:hypothetical protein